MRAASDCRPSPTARHASQPRTAPSTPPSKRAQSTAAPLHGEGGQRRRRTAAPRHTSICGPRPCSALAAPPPSHRSPTRHVPRQQQQGLDGIGLDTVNKEFLAIEFKRTQDMRSKYAEEATKVAQAKYRSLLEQRSPSGRSSQRVADTTNRVCRGDVWISSR